MFSELLASVRVHQPFSCLMSTVLFVIWLIVSELLASVCPSALFLPDVHGAVLLYA